MAATRAVHVRGKAAAIEQEHHLAFVAQGISHGPFQGRANGTKPAWDR